MPFGKLIEQGPNLIKEAGKSRLGVISLIILLLSFVALIFFRNSPDSVKIPIFVLLLLAAGGCVWALIRLRMASTHERVEPPHIICRYPPHS